MNSELKSEVVEIPELGIFYKGNPTRSKANDDAKFLVIGRYEFSKENGELGLGNMITKITRLCTPIADGYWVWDCDPKFQVYAWKPIPDLNLYTDILTHLGK